MNQPNNETLVEFYELQQRIKEDSKRLEELKNTLKARGTFSTKEFACVVLEQSQERLVGLSEVAKVFGRETLERYELIKINTFKTVKVSPLVRKTKKTKSM